METARRAVPDPELVALVVGIMLTLFLLPRLGQPVMTGVVGISVTAIAVGAMRKMPYSPVPFGTRLHRIARLYTSPVSVSTGDESHAVNTVSTVRPQIEVLDMGIEPVHAHPSRPRRTPSPTFVPPRETDEWADMFGGQQRSAAADLFG